MSGPRTLPLAHRMARMEASAIREILKVAERPDILSFAGGLPAPELFPIEALADAHARVLAREGAAALQYSATEGFAPLRDWISARLRAAGIDCDVEHTLITTGSQQGIDLAARVLVNPGDRVAVENPSYIAALQVFSGYEARFAAIASDGDGLQFDALPGDNGDVAKASEEHEAGQARQRTTQHEGSKDNALRRETGNAGSIRVRANRIKAAPPRQVADNPLENDDDQERQEENGADIHLAKADHVEARQVYQPLRQLIGEYTVGARDLHQDRPVQRQGT